MPTWATRSRPTRTAKIDEIAQSCGASSLGKMNESGKVCARCQRRRVYRRVVWPGPAPRPAEQAPVQRREGRDRCGRRSLHPIVRASSRLSGPLTGSIRARTSRSRRLPRKSCNSTSPSCESCSIGYLRFSGTSLSRSGLSVARRETASMVPHSAPSLAISGTTPEVEAVMRRLAPKPPPAALSQRDCP